MTSILTRSPLPKAKKLRVLVIGRSAFSDAIALGLSQEGYHVRSEPSGAQARPHLLSEAADLAVFVTTRLGSEFPDLDEAMAGTNTPWAVVELTCGRLLVGPGVRPGDPLCHVCIDRRKLSHLTPEAAQEEVECRAHFEAHPELEVTGYLPSTVGFAVEGVQSLLDGRLDWGVAREIELLTLGVRQGRFLAVHGCRRCRPAPLEPQRRFVDDLAALLG